MLSPSFSSHHPDFPLSPTFFSPSNFPIFFSSSSFSIFSSKASLLNFPHLQTSINFSHYFLPFQLGPFSQIQLTMKSVIFINFLLASLISTVSSIYLGKVNVAIQINYVPPRYKFVLIPYGVVTPVDNCKTFLYNILSSLFKKS